MQQRFSRFRIIKELGRGGMGVVFEAEDPHLQRTIALKVMRSESAKRADARERFLREARAMAALKHDHVVTVHDVGEDAGIPFIAMELLKGASLEAMLKRNSRFSMAAALKIGMQIAKGLEAAHDAGLIHRDIKPGNIWLEAKTNRVKILDFGLARLMDPALSQITQTGTVLGTPSYMSPEQARGASTDHRSDLFSLGCILFRLVTGSPPFSGENAFAVITAIATETPPSPISLNPNVPAALSGVIERLLEKSPEQRPATARAVVEELAQISRRLTAETKNLDAARTLGPETQPLSVAVPPPVPVPRRRWLSWALGSLALLPLAVTGVVLAFKNNSETKDDEPQPPEAAVPTNDGAQPPKAQAIKSFKGTWRVTIINFGTDVCTATADNKFVGPKILQAHWRQTGSNIELTGRRRVRIGKKKKKWVDLIWKGRLESDGDSITMTSNLGHVLEAVRLKRRR